MPVGQEVLRWLELRAEDSKEEEYGYPSEEKFLIEKKLPKLCSIAKTLDEYDDSDAFFDHFVWSGRESDDDDQSLRVAGKTTSTGPRSGGET